MQLCRDYVRVCVCKRGGMDQYRTLPLSWYEDQHDNTSRDRQQTMEGTVNQMT